VSRALAAELLKLRTTRTFFGVVLSGVLLAVGIAALAASLGTYEDLADAPGQDLVGIATFALLFALVLGILAVSTELRHGTITPTLLAVPSRARLIAAKVAAHALAGFALGLVVVVLVLCAVEGILSMRDIESGTSLAEALRWTAGVSAGAGLLAALGVGIGAVVRNQVGALVGVLAWLFVAEPLLGAVRTLDDPIARFGLSGLMEAVGGAAEDGGDLLPQLSAGLVLAAYAVIAALAGAALLRRRDVT
jgi:ABC-2 type transport system permease protein